ncbi:Glucokinase [Synechococcus sp. MIT S9509]|uniref:glucokinase n=1 Tax=unclassified Synechococcus TaxID=2626047 RepID=UPI0007BC27D1|nr:MULTISPECIES: glucokinase [unclassified Synechococcus]KZR85976.1 Glucokinase [Synechococcus sp. MIT S9504]KZR92039.1 Glucokinase [Synechococcus sp. MIT S9509]
MAAKTYLAGDLGGTKTLLSIYREIDGQLKKEHSHRYKSADWHDLESMLKHFLDQTPAELPRPNTSCIAVAGPVHQGSAKLTNLPWQMSQTSLSAATGLQHLELVNDFAVLIHGLSHFSHEQQVVLQIGRDRSTPAPAGAENGPVAILGAGTGLGMARGLPTPSGWLAIPSEGGHREFAPRNEAEWELAQWLKQDLGLPRLSIERIVSGTGLGHVMNWLLHRQSGIEHFLMAHAHAWRTLSADQPGYQDLPSCTGKAAANGDHLAGEAMKLWLGAYGSVAGDLALQELCIGGLWIGGGTAPKNLDGLGSRQFLEPLRSKGRFRSLIEGMTIRAVIDPEAGLFSAACRARDLLESGGTLA